MPGPRLDLAAPRAERWGRGASRSVAEPRATLAAPAVREVEGGGIDREKVKHSRGDEISVVARRGSVFEPNGSNARLKLP